VSVFIRYDGRLQMPPGKQLHERIVFFMIGRPKRIANNRYHQCRNIRPKIRNRQQTIIIAGFLGYTRDSGIGQKGSQTVQKFPSVIIIQEYLLGRLIPLPITW